MQDDLTRRLEQFYDAVPRGDARVENVGTFTLFIPEVGGFPYYARPTLGATTFPASDVEAVRERQRTLGVPEAFEWQYEATPALADVLRGCGLSVHEHPLQVLSGPVRAPAAPAGVSLVPLTGSATDEDIRTALAVADTAFAHGGTASGPAGADALPAALAKIGAEAVARRRCGLAGGRSYSVVAKVDGLVAAVASAQTAAGVAELVGVATLPAYRRRGLGALVTAAVARAAAATLTFLSAGDDDIARMYATLGFRRVGTAGIATPR